MAGEGTLSARIRLRAVSSSGRRTVDDVVRQTRGLMLLSNCVVRSYIHGAHIRDDKRQLKVPSDNIEPTESKGK